VKIHPAAKLDAIAQIRADIQQNMKISAVPPGKMFNQHQTKILDAFFDYFIDCIAELELKSAYMALEMEDLRSELARLRSGGGVGGAGELHGDDAGLAARRGG